MSANIDLVCSRCGIKHTLKLLAYEKRIERKHPTPTICEDCKQYPEQMNLDEFWEFVKTTLKLT